MMRRAAALLLLFAAACSPLRIAPNTPADPYRGMSWSVWTEDRLLIAYGVPESDHVVTVIECDRATKVVTVDYLASLKSRTASREPLTIEANGYALQLTASVVESETADDELILTATLPSPKQVLERWSAKRITFRARGASERLPVLLPPTLVTRLVAACGL